MEIQKDEKGRFVKGSGGREKGAKNKLTADIKAPLTLLMNKHIVKLDESLDNLEKKDKKAYVEAIIKILPYFVPKKSEIDLDAKADITIRFDFDIETDEDNRV
jgi:hypothetical protein